MAKVNGAQSVEVIPGRKIVLSAGVGKTNVDELLWLTDTVLAEAAAWKNTGWAYIADCSKMLPVGASESGELVKMTKKFVDAGCKAFGFAESEAFSMSTALTQLAGDVASFYNISQDEAYTKLKSVFTGETETLKDLGVVMTQNALDSYALAKGMGKTTKQMSEQEKVALRYSFVLDQLSAAQGDFARTSDSWANQTRILSLNFDTFKANIGQALINIFTPFLKIINQIVSKMAQLSSYFVAFSEMLVGKSTSGGGGSPGAVLEDLAGGYDDVTDSAQKAEKAQNKYLSGLDEIRTFTSKDTSGEAGTAGSFNNLNILAILFFLTYFKLIVSSSTAFLYKI